ncbi:MAG: hypothetical protein ABIB71_01175 [Candidatus Woesearchaeota archaeon]
MRPKLLIFFLIIFSVAAFAQPSVELQREHYSHSETVIASIEKEGFRLSDLSLVYNFTSNVKTGIIAVETGNNSHVAYFGLDNGLEEGSYELRLSYVGEVDGIRQALYASAPFVLSKSNISVAVRPPIVWLEDKGTFSISLNNVGTEPVEISVGAVPGLIPARASISLSPSEKKNLFVQYDSSAFVDGSTLELSYSGKSYGIMPFRIEEPEELPQEDANVTEEPQKPKGKGLVFENNVSEISHSLTLNQKVEGNLSFKNLLSSNLHNATFHISEEFAHFTDFRKAEFPVLRPNKTYVQHVSFNAEKNVEPGTYSGIIIVDTAEGYSASIAINLEFEQLLPIEEEPSSDMNVTEVEPFDLEGFNYSEGTEEDKPERNITLGLALSAILFLILVFIVYKLWPRSAKKKFNELVRK